MKKLSMAELAAVILRATTDNLGLKLFSFLIALALFLFVRGPDGEGGASRSQQTFDVSVIQDTTGNDGTHVLVSDVPPLVRVTLSGSRYLLSTVDPGDLRTSIRLRDATMTYYYFSPDDLRGAPAGLEVAFEPRELPLKWDNRIERVLPVRVRVEGTLPAGLHVVQPVGVTPAEVRVVGAQGSFPRGEVATEPIDIHSLGAGRHERTLRLEPPPAHVSYKDASTVNVAVEIIPVLRERVLHGLEVVAVGPSGLVRPRVVDVTLSGSAALIDALSPDAIVPWVDATRPALAGTAPVQVQVRGVPEGVTLVNVIPEEVLLTVNP